MAITRWDPFRDILTLQNRMNSAFEDYNRRDAQTDSRLDSRPDFMAAAFAPPVDIYEDTHRIVLNLEAPGMKQEQFDIEVENNTLTVRGERKFAAEQKEENYHRVERRYGSFYRAFTLPQTVNTEQVQASYDAGILRIELAKRAEARPKQIKVSVGGPNGNGDQQTIPSGSPQQVERTASA